MRPSSRFLFLRLIPVALIFAGITIACSGSVPEKPGLSAGRLLSALDSVRNRLQIDLYGDRQTTVAVTAEKDSTYAGPADSLVTYKIGVPPPVRYYSVTVTARYFSRTDEAEKVFREEYQAFHETEIHSEGLLAPEAHYRIGNCIFALHYGCALSQTNTEKMLLGFFDRVYKEKEATNSFIRNSCGGGSTHSKDLD